MKFIQSTTLLVALFSSSLLAQELSTNEYNELKAKSLKEYKDKNYLNAYNSLMKLYRQDPLDSSLYIPMARAAHKAKKYNQAVMSYERALEENPNNSQIYTELASVYSAINDNQQAKYYLEMAKKTANSSQNVDSSINKLENNDKTTLWQTGIRVGAGYDSNANRGASSREVVLGTSELVLNSSSQAEDSLFTQANFWLKFIRKLDSNNKYMLISDLNVYSKMYEDNEVNDNNLIWTEYALGVRTYFETFYLDVQGVVDYANYDFDTGIYSYGIQADLNARVYKNLHLKTELSIQNKNYESNKDYDGFLTKLSQRFTYLLNEKDSISAQIKYTNRDTKQNDYTYNAIDTQLRYAHALNKELYVIPNIGYAYRKYQGPATSFETEDREDKKVWVGASGVWYFNDNVSADVNYRYTDNDSNSDVYSYLQHITTLSITYHF